MQYIDLTTNKVKSKRQILNENKDKSVPSVWNANVYAALNVAPIYNTPEPVPSGPYKTVSQGSPEYVDGQWRTTWSEQDMFSDTLDKTKAEQEAEYQAKLDEAAAIDNRSQRDNLLAETDWVVIKAQETGVAVDAAWATYRQALRDITTHANWPHLTEADWPVKP